jgi:CubicO group peptidase (beta-lactamase class C family)
VRATQDAIHAFVIEKSCWIEKKLEDGKLGLDDEVSRYLPAFRSPQVLSRFDLAAGTYETRPATRPITIGSC